jgi:lysophospholipase L1-like esterase
MSGKWVAGSIASLAMVFAVYAGEIPVKNGETIAFVGDSITKFGDRPDGFIHLVMDGLKQSGVNAKMIPAGIGGNKSDDILKRLPEILDHKTEWMVLQCGTNDVGHGENGVSLEDYKKNMTAILDAAQRAGVKVMLVTPSMHTERAESDNNRKMEGYCEFLRKQANERKLLLVDWNNAEREAIKKRGHIKGLKVTLDNLHLNGYGNRFLAEAILAGFGVPEAKIVDMKKEWNKIPSMTPILNAWYDPQYKISIDDYEVLYRLADAQNMSVDEFVKKLISNCIERSK